MREVIVAQLIALHVTMTLTEIKYVRVEAHASLPFSKIMQDANLIARSNIATRQANRIVCCHLSIIWHAAAAVARATRRETRREREGPIGDERA